ncbi:unnamed protein product [Calypogeia fissa]
MLAPDQFQVVFSEVTIRELNMPRNETVKSSAGCCSHTRLSFEPTAQVVVANYQRPALKKRAAATTSSGREPHTIDVEASDSSTFPAPLILPGDDLALDPKYPAQSVRAWIREKERNKVTHERRTIYVAAPPDVDLEVGTINTWSQPAINIMECPMPIASPSVNDVGQYLSAFYYGMPVKLLPPSTLRFTSWNEGASSTSKRRRRQANPKSTAETEDLQFIGLTTSAEIVRIGTRQTPSAPFRRQLNLNDLLDVAIAVLPDDAYALLLLVEHDLFEDENDDFCCGRAYGGSSVAVVSMARYHPGLDTEQSVERHHSWPASHCEKYLNSCCSAAEKRQCLHTNPKKKRAKTDIDCRLEETQSPVRAAISPLQAAVSAHNGIPSCDSSSKVSTEVLEGLWLGRVCKTASHELGHCFGIDHCVYYACIMQGTASVAEDARQPPYLCPVDEAKLESAIGGGKHERVAKVIEFCDKKENENTHLFRAFAAWLRARTKA